jgi:hypothetical protein
MVPVILYGFLSLATYLLRTLTNSITMVLMMFKKVFVLASLCFAVHAFSWEDRPDVEDHRETDRLLRLANEQTGYNEYEREQLEKESQEALKNYKASKFKKKDAEKAG